MARKGRAREGATQRSDRRAANRPSDVALWRRSILQEASERIRIRRPGFAWFLSGPSKTADIEQSLVIGAHGARSSTVYIVD